jgi:hypothetical protein
MHYQVGRRSDNLFGFITLDPEDPERAESFSAAVDPNRTTEMTIAASDRDVQASE